jgi:anoctamin-10/anoctamin-7
LGEYSEVAIQFGYVALFASALPIASLASLFAFLIEVKADTIKFLYVYRRPQPTGALDIGLWYVAALHST